MAQPLLSNRRAQQSIFLGLIVAFFVFSNAVGLSLAIEGQIKAQHFFGPIIWLVVHAATVTLLLKYRPTFDPIILAILMLLSGWSILLVDRLALNFLSRQISWVVLGTAVVLTITLFPKNLNWLRKYRYTLLLIGLALLAATLFFGVNPSGAATANYWLRLPFAIPVFFQPSELLKLLLVIFLASYFDEQEFINQSKKILVMLAPIGIMAGFCMLLLVWQQDLGAATLFFILFLSLFYIATGKRTYLLAGLLLLIVAGGFAYYWFDVVALRIDAWINPWPDADGRAFQIVQSLYALASGGIFGQGIGQGFPDYIPVVHSDFVFAAIGEEWGLIGSLTTLFCFALLMHRGMLIGIRAIRPFHRYLATGITILLSAQSILIMGGVTKSLPLTGVTLPFVSYGGSSMIVSHMMVGLLLYLSCQSRTTNRLALPLTASQNHLRQVHLVLILAFAGVALTLLYWPLMRSSTILLRDDNPRQVEAALRIQRGTILDRDGLILAQTSGNGNELTRQYPIASIGPAVGYYSFRHGTAGIEAGFDNQLSQSDRTAGDLFFSQQLLHQPTIGQNVQLTLSANYQEIANQLMAQQTGSLLLFKLADDTHDVAEILSMVSFPSYDPNQLDAEFDFLIKDETAPLLNRTTLGQYQPGMILQPFVLATAVHHGDIFLNQRDSFSELPVIINDQQQTCHEIEAALAQWEDVLAARCPAPMTLLGDRVGIGGLSQSFANFGFTKPLTIPLDIEPTAVSLIESPQLAAIGQDSLTVTPLILGRAWIALMTNGRLPTIQIVSHIQNRDGVWQPLSVLESDDAPAISPSVAAVMQEILPQTEDHISEFSGTAVSGPENSRNSWYMGEKEINGSPHFVIIILENSDTITAAEKIGRGLLRAISQN